MSAPETQSDLISLAAAAKLTGYHQDYLGALCRSGKLPGVKMGRNWVVSEQRVRDFAKQAAMQAQRPFAAMTEVEPAVESVMEHVAPAVEMVPTPVMPDTGTTISFARVLAGVATVLAVVGAAVFVVSVLSGPRAESVLVAGRTDVEQAQGNDYDNESNNNDDNDNDNDQRGTVGQKNENDNDQTPDLSLRGSPCSSTEGTVLSQSKGDRGNLNSTDAQNADCFAEPRNDKKGQVLGDSISLQPQPVDFSNSGLSEYDLNQLIAQQLANLASIGLLGSGPRPASESASGAGSPSSSTYNSTTLQPTTAPVISYIQPAPAQNFNGASLLSATDLSSTRFTTTTANITDTATIKTLSVTENATVGGDLTITGNITGNVIGTINPSFTLGSIPFQGASNLTQDNANFFWDDTNNRLGVGTSSPSATVHIKSTGGVGDNNGLIVTNGSASVRLLSNFATMNEVGLYDSNDAGIAVSNVNTSVFKYAGGEIEVHGSGGNVLLAMQGGGNVGIGTTAPAGALDMYASVPRLVWTDAQDDDFSMLADGSEFLLRNESAGQYMASFKVGAIDLFTNEVSRLYIDTNGNVGIGTTTPAGKFVVKGSGTTTGIGLQTQNSSGSALFTTLDNGNVGIGTTAPTAPLHIVVNSLQSGLKLQRTAATAASYEFYIANDGHLAVYDNAATVDRLRLDTDGKFTIGSPNTNLSAQLGVVNGNAATPALRLKAASGQSSDLFSLYNSSGSTIGMRIRNDGILNVGTETTDTVYNGSSGTANIIGPSGYWGIRTSTANAFNLDVYNSGSPLAALTVLQNGNVGIGTTVPAAKLQVNGTIKVATASPQIDLGATGAPGYIQLRRSADGSATGFIGFTGSNGNEFEIRNQSGGTNSITLNNTQFQLSASAAVTNGITFLTNGGTEQMRITAGGNVGIGTTAPIQKFEVADNTTAPRMLLNTTLTSDSYSGYQFNSGATFKGGLFRHASNDDIQIWTAGDTSNARVNIQNGGRVKIGSTADGVGSITSAKVEIQGNGAVENTLALFDTQAAAADAGGSISLGGYSSGSTAGARYAVIGGLKENATAANTAGYLIFSTNNNGGVNSTSERMRITSAGNVGIGTTAPGYKLAVAGEVNSAVTSTTGKFSLANGTQYISSDSASGAFAIQNGSGGGYSFSITQNGATPFSINTSNYIGIGTTSPAAALHVSTAGNLGSAFFSGGTSGGYNFLQIRNDTNSAANALGLAFTGSAYAGTFLTSGVAGTSGNVYTDGANPLQFGTNSTARMVIAAGGNVGIGTTTPASKVEVTTGTPGADTYTIVSKDTTYNRKIGFYWQNGGAEGGIKADSRINLNPAGALMLNPSDGSGSGITYSNGLFGAGDTGSLGTPGSKISVNGGVSIGNGYYTTSAPTNGMIVQGNVGVGTTAPTEKMHVVGNGLFTGTVTAAGLTNTGATSIITTSSPQLTVGYDSTNKYTTAVSSTGGVTFDASGSGAAFVFSDSISSPGSGTNSERFGAGSSANIINGVAVGQGASVTVNHSIAIGQAATVGGSGTQNVLVGQGSTLSTTGRTVAVGSGITISAGNSQTVIGTGSTASGSYSVVVGENSTGNFDNVIVLGRASDATAANQFVAGSDTMSISDIYFGNGVTHTSTSAITINGTGGSGTNIAGGNLALAGGKATGNNAGGDILFQTSDVGSTGATLQSLTTKMTVKANGSVGIGMTNPGAKLEVRVVSTSGTGGLDGMVVSDSTDTRINMGVSAGSYGWVGASQSAVGSKPLVLQPGGGNVGIGTTVPGQKLDVYSASSVRLGLRSDVGRDWRLAVNEHANGDFALASAVSGNSTYTSHLVVTGSTGNVGIGTSTPSSLLHMATTRYVDTSSLRIISTDSSGNPGTFAGTATGSLRINPASSSGLGEFVVFNDAGVLYQGYNQAGNTQFGQVKFNSSGLGLFTNSVERIRVDTVGNVGIGTTSPASLLAVSASSGAGANAISLANTNIAHGMTTYIAATDRVLNLGSIGSTLGGAYIAGASADAGRTGTVLAGVIGVTDPTDTVPALLLTGGKKNTTDAQALGAAETVLQVENGAPTVGTKLLTILGSGNVGIGTTSPAAKLEVTGGAVAGLKVTGSNDASIATVDIVTSGNTNIPFRITDTSYNPVMTISKTTGAAGYAATVSGIAINATYQHSPSGGYGNLGRGIDISVVNNTGSGVGAVLTGAKIAATANTAGVTAIGLDVTVASTSGTPYAALFNGGNVGIGTTAPTVKLDVIGAVRSSDSIFVDRTGGALTNYLSFNMRDAAEAGNFGNVWGNGAAEITAYQSAGLVIGTHSGGGVALATNNTSRLLIDTAGNVGIGTSTPGYKLDVNGTANIVGDVTLTSGNISSTSGMNLSPGTNSNFILYGNGNARLTMIANSGNIGIGTTSPGARLHASSSVSGETIRLGGGTTSDAGITFYGSDNNQRGSIAVNTASVALQVLGTTNSILQLGANNSVAATITTAGNVGIGTTSPASALDVVGYLITRNSVPELTFRDTTAGDDDWTINVDGDILYIQQNVGDASWASRLTIGATGNIDTVNADLGDGTAGKVLTLGRNTNATNTGAGSINYQSKAGTAGYVWQDNAGNMRIHTAAPSNANDTAGTVIGTQTSTRDTKQDIQEYTDYAGALQAVINAPLRTFKYIKEVEGYGPSSPLAKSHIGFIADEVSGDFMQGNSIDQVSVNGLLMASVKALNEQTTQLSVILANAGIQSEQGSGFRLGGRNDTPVISYNANSNYVIVTKQLYLSGDSVGQAKILAGSTSVRVTFSHPYEQQPIVTATARGRVVGSYWVQDEDASGFTLYIENPQAGDVAFSYHVFASPEAKLTVSNGISESIALVLPPAPPANLPELEEITDTPPEVVTEPAPTPTPDDQTPLTQAGPLPTEPITPEDQTSNGGAL